MSTSPISAAKNMQGYVPATQRQRCETCQRVGPVYGSSLNCSKGGFLVTKYSVCQDWEIKQPPGFKRPT